ncbi:HEPN domain-containing protein [Candidatus Woesearchaeota archaeon]|nr:HEPN domain-containing protein [Candidatus Woesearchaeota archaeon]
MLEGINGDLKRAKKALESAERNFKEDDILTAANRAFVACENSVYVLLKLKFGSTSISRIKILTKLKEIDPILKETYDQSYDLRVQADYGRQSKYLPLTKENLGRLIEKVRKNMENIARKTN